LDLIFSEFESYVIVTQHQKRVNFNKIDSAGKFDREISSFSLASRTFSSAILAAAMTGAA
jgi:hypothetical protein